MQTPHLKTALFDGSGRIPSLRGIQGWLERAWARGFDREGAESFGGQLLGKRGQDAWIGATDVAALLRSFAIDAVVVDVHACAGKGWSKGSRGSASHAGASHAGAGAGVGQDVSGGRYSIDDARRAGCELLDWRGAASHLEGAACEHKWNGRRRRSRQCHGQRADRRGVPSSSGGEELEEVEPLEHMLNLLWAYFGGQCISEVDLDSGS